MTDTNTAVSIIFFMVLGYINGAFGQQFLNDRFGSQAAAHDLSTWAAGNHKQPVESLVPPSNSSALVSLDFSEQSDSVGI